MVNSPVLNNLNSLPLPPLDSQSIISGFQFSLLLVPPIIPNNQELMVLLTIYLKNILNIQCQGLLCSRILLYNYQQTVHPQLHW